MHFHLPKPLHGWREFTGEVGIIVVGVLIALGAEQVVEAMHWKDRARHARQALAGELAGHYDQAIEWRIIEPCVAAQLDRLEQRLLASGDRIEPAPLFHEEDRTFVLRAPSRPYPTAVWQGVVAEGVSSHLTDAERLDFGIYYQQLHDLDALNKELTATETKLNSLARPLTLDPSAAVVAPVDRRCPRHQPVDGRDRGAALHGADRRPHAAARPGGAGLSHALRHRRILPRARPAPAAHRRSAEAAQLNGRP
jgi:hypothetical protein